MDDRDRERREQERRDCADEAVRLRRQLAGMRDRRHANGRRLFTVAGVRGTLATYERMLER